ncbi:NAD(P)/FAD-dependent oxidoreductase [Clostridium hydrogeniformans]|uniref:NAD(P)/FAD-dependent oxidoreductase n=1 Tax=Clostridium hydrogeniformans TaxID=349933 RepID=UPI000483A8D8|nr:hypothetical protein [Clostridium hydrogeniformans]
MTLRVNNIVLDIDEDIEKDTGYIYKKLYKKLNISEGDIKEVRIIKESLDARRKNSIRFNYCVDVECLNEDKILKRIKDNDVKLEDKQLEDHIVFGSKELKSRPVVVGFGPSGIFSALLLARNGYRPLVIERGEAVEERSKTVEEFWKTGKLNKESNVQFGEGGAGTFSDGKLTTRIKDRRCDYILKELVDAGAPKEIIYRGKPHIGTDILKDVVKNIREEIISLGGEVLFNSKLEEINSSNGKITSIIVNGEEVPCEALILAIGHSSRDTYEMLYKNGVNMEAKPFSIGVRVEHLQDMMDENQYGIYKNHPRLKASDYRLAYTSKKLDRSIYSFCMCPGGEVVGASSEEERLVTNGMSYYKRDLKNANSAIVVSVSPKDFQGSNPLRGMEFQRYYEALAYKVGGGNYKAPVQLISDFMKDNITKSLGNVEPTYRPGYEFKDMRECLPSYVIDGLKEGFMEFEKKIKGFATSGGVMTGIETRTSAPVRIERNTMLQSTSLKGLYPSGEGAGFAGGIISAAVDGMKVAEEIMKEFKNME